MFTQIGIKPKIMAIEINIWIYWLFCTLAMLSVILNKNFVYSLLRSNSSYPQKDGNYINLLIGGWITTFLASISYVIFTSKNAAGTYQISDLLAFSVLNGILEQFMFVFWFLIGCYLARLRTSKNSSYVFIWGYVCFFIFAGFIHAFFWIKVLPKHKPATAIIIPLLSIMSYFWMRIYWQFKKIMPTIFMHIFVDFITIGHLHFSWF